MLTVEFAAWIDAAGNTLQKEFRMAVHLVLIAISKAPSLPDQIVLKGGILLALAHEGDRFTRDIDFSTSLTAAELPLDTIRDEIEDALTEVAVDSSYGLDCRIQSSRLNPPDPEKNWPTLILTVGYAPFSDARRHRRLVAGHSPTVVRVECSYNEIVSTAELLEVAPGTVVRTYTTVDLVAEKYRALLQQPVRDRYRRQDAYDVNMLLDDPSIREPSIQSEILKSLIQKCASRDIVPTIDSLDDEEVRRRAARDYDQLRDEITGTLPAFNECYERVKRYYRGLPWGEL